MIKAVSSIFLALVICINTAFASRWGGINEYGEYKPEWEINAQTNSEVPLFKIKAQGRIGGIGGCGIQSTAFYRLAMMLNKDTLKELLENWENLAFIGVLYTIGTYFPIVKEAMVGAEMIANTIASLKNLNCQSATRMMSSYFKRTSALVRACVANRLGGNVNPWELDSDKIKKIIEKAGVSEGKIANAYYYCMNNASILDSFDLRSASFRKWLNKKNLRKWIVCNYVSAFGMQDLGDRYSLSSTLIYGGDAKTMAQIALLAITPEWIVSKRDKDWILTPKKIQLDTGEEVSPELLFDILKKSVDNDFKTLIQYAKNGEEEEFYNKVDQMNRKFYIKNEDVLPYFDFIYLGYRAIQKFESEGRYDKARQLKPIMESYVSKFKGQYYLLKKKAVEKQIVKQFYQVKARVQASKVAGKDSFEKYCNNNGASNANNQ